LADTITKPVGTGPYQIKEHVLDQYLQLEKFDKYASRSEPSNGAAGKRAQTMAQIRFVPVADPNTRVEGTMSGQFDFADSLPTESFARLDKSASAKPVVYEAFGWPVYAINHKAGLMTNKKIRQAVEAALPMDDMLFAAFGDEKFYQLDGAMYPKGWVWHNDDGLKLFNQNNHKKAAGLLKEAHYDGKPLRILTSHQYEFHFKMTQVAQMALQAAGFKVQMDVVDWATLGQRRNDPALWDIYVTHSPFLPEPALTDMWSKTSRLGWANPQKDATFETFTTVTDLAKRQAAFAQLQGELYEDVGFLKIGSFSALWGQAKGLSGVPKTPWPFFWNATLSA
ncbi:ABC transporter substrate-binding protein, partial [Thioclava sp. BHET1]